MLAFVGAALVGLVAPSGCVMAPEGGCPSRESIEGTLHPSEQGRCNDGYCEATCGAPSEDCGPTACSTECESCPCPPRPHVKFWHHLPKCHLYDPEAGIFNFCVPPQCLNPLPPLPPGRFFPVPVRPAFAQQSEIGYGLMNGGGGNHSGPPARGTAVAPCP